MYERERALEKALNIAIEAIESIRIVLGMQKATDTPWKKEWRPMDSAPKTGEWIVFLFSEEAAREMEFPPNIRTNIGMWSAIDCDDMSDTRYYDLIDALGWSEDDCVPPQFWCIYDYRHNKIMIIDERRPDLLPVSWMPIPKE